MDLKRAWVWSTLCQQLPGGQRNYLSKCWRISRRAWLRIVSVNFSGLVILRFRRMEHGLLNIGTNHQLATIYRNPSIRRIVTPIYTRFIRLAANPAPKPLSILTTVTPAAQELSIPKRAASP